MNRPPETLVVGIGSPHGDDTAGWNVVDQLGQCIESPVNLRKAASPHDLLDWLAEVEYLHVVDACQAVVGVQSVDLSADHDGVACPMLVRQHIDLTTTRESAGMLPETRCLYTHQLDLLQVLDLAKALDRLPSHVTLWAIAGKNFSPGSDLSATSKAAIEFGTRLIQRELRS